MKEDTLFLYDIYDAIGGIAFSDVIVENSLNKLQENQKELFKNMLQNPQNVKLLMGLKPDFEIDVEMKNFLLTNEYFSARNNLLLQTLIERKAKLSSSLMAQEVSDYFGVLIKWLTGYCDMFVVQSQEQRMFSLVFKLSPDESALRSLLEMILLHNQELFKIDNILKLFMEVQWSIKNLE